jgi:hypothetical protein
MVDIVIRFRYYYRRIVTGNTGMTVLLTALTAVRCEVHFLDMAVLRYN